MSPLRSRLADGRTLPLLTYTFLSGALVAGAAWIATARSLEAVVNTLVLLGGATGVLNERRAAARRGRRLALSAITAETAWNRDVLGNAPFRPGTAPPSDLTLPRLRVRAVETALVTAVFQGRGDQVLAGLLTAWCDAADDLNHRLAVVEADVFGCRPAERADRHRVIMESVRNSAELRAAIDACAALTALTAPAAGTRPTR
ncbi:hypothetical protein [Yinghuangia soli]|uniref:Uncharacterized protein n=1 Tax=Yinghuangia soli TaxID=2908204 RepID=A0AA41U0K1_9ACTN|nr:hypothetical protein [Yinghuangia soli]MCF2528676.1 hypothetical protein [Yinghuangia soli]